MKALAVRRPRFGQDRITALLRKDTVVNHKRVERLWRQEGLQVPRKRRRRRYSGVTDNSSDRMREYWESLYEDLGTFSLLGRQCTSTAIKSMESGGLYKRGFWVNGPQDLLKEMKKVKHTCGPNKGKRVKVKQIKWEAS